MHEPPTTPRVTIRDVAAAAGVSTATVSLALNGRGEVNAETAERVVRAAEALGYRASRTARALRTQRTGILAIVFSVIDPPQHGAREPSFEYYLRLIGGASRRAFAADQRLLLAPPLLSAADVHDLGADGAIICDPVRLDPQLDLCREHGLPVVTVERDEGRPDFEWHANSDNARTIELVLDHLAARGAKQIALIAPTWDTAWTNDSVGGYRAWVQRHGRPELIARATDAARTLETGAWEAAGALLDGPEPPDAILAMPERFSRGIVRAARDRGLRVPEDLLVAAAMDSADEREGTPAVTAVDLDPQRLGEAVVDLLLARIAGEDPERPVVLPAELRVRASTGGEGS